jgi:hypothetical protein
MNKMIQKELSRSKKSYLWWSNSIEICKKMLIDNWKKEFNWWREKLIVKWLYKKTLMCGGINFAPPEKKMRTYYRNYHIWHWIYI